MKKTREMNYTVCDDCEKEVVSVVNCAKCNKELCRHCYKSTPFASYSFCEDCYGSSLKKICEEFEKEWKVLMEEHDTKCDTMFKKYGTRLEEIITDPNEKD